jgi:hypothetical protein
MISNNGQTKQLPNELTSTFKELQVLKHLRKAGITKSLSVHTIGKVTKLSNHDRPKVLILDDSSYDRNRNETLES